MHPNPSLVLRALADDVVVADGAVSNHPSVQKTVSSTVAAAATSSDRKKA